MKRPQNIDDLVRQGLQDSAGPPPDFPAGASDWDIPSEGVWNEVERRLNPSRRRREAFWWILGGFLLVTIAAILLLAKIDVNDNRGEKRNADNVIALVQPPQSINADVPDVIGQGSDSAPAPVDHNSTQPSSSRTDSDPTQSPEQPPYVSNDIDRQDVPSVPLQIKSPLASQLQNEEHTEDTHSDRFMLLVAPEPLSSGPFYLQWASTMPDAPFTGPIIPKRDKSSWHVTLAMSPSFGTRDIQVPDASPRVRRNLLLQHEDPSMQLGFRLNISRDLSSRWSIGAGIHYSRYVLGSTFQHQLRYTRAGEIQNNRGNFENRLNLNLNTSFGEVNTDIIIERSSDATIDENQFINLALNARQSMQVIQLPIVLKYQVPLGRLKMAVRGGPAANILLENRMELSAIRSLNTDILQTRAMKSVDLAGSRGVAVGYHMGAELEIPLDRQWSVVIAPDLSGYLQPVYRDRHVRIFPHAFGVFLGAKYKFK